MILTTHAVVGAALATFLPSYPAAAFAVGFASHFVLDAIPHADYPIRSRSINPAIGAPMKLETVLFWDLLTIGSDGLFGLLAAVFLFGTPTALWAILFGAIGAMLPDPLQVMCARFPREPLRTLQKFHRWAHTGRQIQDTTLAVATQAGFVAVIVGTAISVSHGVFDPAFAMVR